MRAFKEKSTKTKFLKHVENILKKKTFFKTR